MKKIYHRDNHFFIIEEMDFNPKHFVAEETLTIHQAGFLFGSRDSPLSRSCLIYALLREYLVVPRS